MRIRPARAGGLIADRVGLPWASTRTEAHCAYGWTIGAPNDSGTGYRSGDGAERLIGSPRRPLRRRAGPTQNDARSRRAV